MAGMIISIAASLLLIAAAVLILARRRAPAGVSLPIALLLLGAVEAVDRLSLEHVIDPLSGRGAGLFLESLLPLAFLLLTRGYVLDGYAPTRRIWQPVLFSSAFLFPATVALFPAADFFYAPDFATERMLFLGPVGYWFYLGLMVCCIAALVRLESIFSATRGAARWRMKFEFIGLAGIMAVLIFYFSQGLLYRTVNMNLVPVRSGIFIVAAVLIGYSKVRSSGDSQVVVSRYILYRSLVLVFVGVYLLSLGLIGEGMKYFGDSFEKNALLFIAFIAGMFIVTLLVSEQFRRRVKVFVNKNFYAQKHDYREVWLRFTGRLASCRSLADVGQMTLTMYRETFGLKGASLYLFEREKNCYRLAANQEMRDGEKELRFSPGLESYFLERHRVLDLKGAEYALTGHDRIPLEAVHAIFVVPLIATDHIVGMVLLGGQLSPEELIFEDYDLMKTIARQAALSLANFQLSEELVETREMAAVARISSFIVHDLKNLSYSLSLLLENAAEHMDNPEFQKDMLGAVGNTVNRVKNLMQKLKGVPEKQMLNSEMVDLASLVAETVEEVRRLKRGMKISYHGAAALTVVDREEIRKVALNLLLNAADAIAADEEIRVETGCLDGMTYIRVADTGCGMTEEFISTSLFKPFRSTKAKGLGIGLYQCRKIIEAHEGRMEVQSRVEAGSVFTVYLPLARGSAGVAAERSIA